MAISNLLDGFPKQLSEPLSYYQGIVSPQRPRSQNLICFQRLNRRTLQQKHFANRSHHRHVLILVLDTAGSVVVNGSEHRLHPGQAYYVRPFQFHHYLNLERDKLRWLFLTFDVDKDTDHLSSISDQTLEPDREAILLWKLISTRAGDPSDQPLQAEALPLLDTLLYRLTLRQRGTPRKVARSSWLAKAEGLIIESVDHGWTVDEIGRKLGVSGRHLRSLFEAEMGVGIRKYRANYQLHRALSLMREPTLSIGRIAELSGFNSQAVFNRFILRHTGKTPKRLQADNL